MRDDEHLRPFHMGVPPGGILSLIAFDSHSFMFNVKAHSSKPGTNY